MAQDYKITRKERTTVLLDGQTPSIGYRVWFYIPETGTNDYIEIEEAKASVETIHRLVADKTEDTLELFREE